MVASPNGGQQPGAGPGGLSDGPVKLESLPGMIRGYEDGCPSANPRRSPMRLIAVLSLTFLSSITLPLAPWGPDPVLAQSVRAGAPRLWTQVNGTVEKVEGVRLRFKLQDGRRMVADISRMSPEARAAVVAGVRTTLYGYTDQQAGRFVALIVELESAAAAAPSADTSSAPSSASMAAAPGQPLDERPWRVVHGRVDRIDADTLTLVTDAGLVVTVDLRGVEPANRTAVGRDDSVTVVGFHSGDLEQLDARFIHRDASETGGRRASAPAPAGRSALSPRSQAARAAA